MGLHQDQGYTMRSECEKGEREKAVATATNRSTKTRQRSLIGSDVVCDARRSSVDGNAAYRAKNAMEMVQKVGASSEEHNSCVKMKSLNKSSLPIRTNSARRTLKSSRIFANFCHDLLVLSVTFSSVATFALASCPRQCNCPTTSNQVTCVGAGYEDLPSPIPPTVTTLDMSDNDLTRLTSTALSPLRNVINLTLKNNDITQIHDGAFSMMTSLQSLQLNSNRLTRLTEYTFSGTSALIILNLADNNLENIDGAFAGMTNLSRLDLSNNRVTNLTQFTLRDLRNLRYLLLAGNQISHIDRRAFRNLNNLIYLILRGNPLGERSRLNFNSPSLNYLDLSECGLRSVPRGLPRSVRYLQLRRNNMSVIRSNEFQETQYVSILVLDENHIHTIQDNPFADMTYLQQLWLNGNRLTLIPSGLPRSLQRLLMDSNHLTNITNVFPPGSELNTLSLMGNNISYLAHDALYSTKRLETIDLSNNRIQHLYGHTFLNSSNLYTLQLSKNPLQLFHSRCFHGLRSLRTLSLAYVGTEATLHHDIFQDMTDLTKLDLDSSPSIILNILYKDDLIQGLANVEDLSLQSSDLTTLRSDFPELFPRLTILHMTSSRWHCDTSLVWLRDWLLSSDVEFRDKDDFRCFTPRSLHDRAITSLEDDEFVAISPSRTTPRIPAFPLTTFPPRTTTTSTTSKATTSLSPPTTIASSTTDTITRASSSPTQDETMNSSPMTSPSTETQYRTSHVTSTPAKKKSTSPPSIVAPTRTKSTSTSVKSDSVTPLPGSPENKSHASARSKTTIIIVIATSLTTLVIAAILLVSIVYFCRKGRRRNNDPRSPNKNNSGKNYKSAPYQNGIKYHHKKDVLYFMPASAEGSDSHESIKTTNSKSSKDANMTLIPGRDINHEGPLRVYKWEDF